MNSPSQLPPPSTFSKICPILVLVIIILAVLVFMYGLLHLLVRVFMKSPSFSAVYQSNRSYPSDTSGTHAFQRQLQQLFKLDDSGLDQTFIDALPVFYYKDIMGGLKQPFDCPVCLSEFCCHDKLRLLPKCSHAFHIHCIDTWFLSNSTCPLCRGSLLSSCGPILENIELPRETKDGFLGDDSKSARIGEMRVLSVRLGKFTRLNNEGCKDRGQGEASSSNLDARRCYSMGAFQYVEVDSDIQVALKNARLVGTTRDNNANSLGDHELEEGKMICGRTRGESFSVSKVWLWSKKSRTQSVGLSLQTNERIERFVDVL